MGDDTQQTANRRVQLAVVAAVVAVIILALIFTIANGLGSSKSTTDVSSTATTGSQAASAANKQSLSDVDASMKRATADQSNVKEAISAQYNRIDTGKR